MTLPVRCPVVGCDRRADRDAGGRRGLCRRHWSQSVGYGPLVCICPEPAADPRVDFGMCHHCGRKPLALFRILQHDEAA